MSFTGLADVDDFLKASIEERLSVADLLAGPSPDVEGNSSQVLNISHAQQWPRNSLLLGERSCHSPTLRCKPRSFSTRHLPSQSWSWQVTEFS